MEKTETTENQTQNLLSDDVVKQYLQRQKDAANRLYMTTFVIFAVTTILFQFLWNTSVAPAVDGINDIGIFQAFGILLAGRFVFK